MVLLTRGPVSPSGPAGPLGPLGPYVSKGYKMNIGYMRCTIIALDHHHLHKKREESKEIRLTQHIPVSQEDLVRQRGHLHQQDPVASSGMAN